MNEKYCGDCGGELVFSSCDETIQMGTGFFVVQTDFAVCIICGYECILTDQIKANEERFQIEKNKFLAKMSD